MIEVKPLHVHVAEALGASVMEVAGVWYDEAEADAAEARSDPFSARPLPHYDTDWSATGDLIERYEIDIRPDTIGSSLTLDWSAKRGGWPFDRIHGPTPLIAVCRLIIALKESGRL